MAIRTNTGLRQIYNGFIFQTQKLSTIVLLSPTKIMTKYRRQQTFIMTKIRHNVNVGHVTITIMQ